MSKKPYALTHEAAEAENNAIYSSLIMHLTSMESILHIIMEKFQKKTSLEYTKLQIKLIPGTVKWQQRYWMFEAIYQHDIELLFIVTNCTFFLV